MTKSAEEKEEQGLVGRFFHILGDEGCVRFHGLVIAQVDPTRYLVQFYNEGTLHVFDIDAMCTANSLRHREPGAWQFYDDEEHWTSWYQENASTKPREVVKLEPHKGGAA
jgi:hypothetical protein